MKTRYPKRPGATEHYQDAAYYDRAYRTRRDDVAYYVALAQNHKPRSILELGCGSGRIGLELLKAGLKLSALDASSAMLQRFKEQAELAKVAEHLQLHSGDIREFKLGERFDLIIAPFNTVLHLYDADEFRAFLNCVREHLNPKGRLVFDLSSPSASILASDPDKWFGSPPFKHPSLGKVKYRERFSFDPTTSILDMDLKFISDSGESIQQLSQRQWFLPELKEVLKSAGIKKAMFSADFIGAEIEPESDSWIINCAFEP